MASKCKYICPLGLPKNNYMNYKNGNWNMDAIMLDLKLLINYLGDKIKVMMYGDDIIYNCNYINNINAYAYIANMSKDTDIYTNTIGIFPVSWLEKSGNYIVFKDPVRNVEHKIMVVI